ncbi:MAG: dTMP kinase [Chloroflexota bacterium]
MARGIDTTGLGLLVSFEGGEGAGKSTQLALAVERVRATGHECLALREPGGTPFGEHLRAYLKSGAGPLSPEAELLAFAAARAELVRAVIAPALERGAVVLTDRFADSTTVYQGAGRGLPARLVNAANELATGGLIPRLTVLLDATPGALLARAAERDGTGGGGRFEDEALEFHQRVRAGFARLARREPERFLVTDALESVEKVHAQVWRRLSPLLRR